MMGNVKDNQNQQHLADTKTVLLKAVSVPLPISDATVLTTKSSEMPQQKHTKKKYSRSLIIISTVCLAVVTGVGLSTWQLFNGPPKVTLYHTNTKNVNRVIGGSGIIFPLQQLEISYPIVERVLEVYVKPGDQVSPDQSLLRLDISRLDAQVKQAADDVAAAQSYLNSVAGSNSLAISQAQRQYDLALARYNSLIAERSSPTLHNGTLVSPLKGVVTRVNIDPGEVAAANAPLLTLQIESTVIAHIQIPLANINQVYIGQQAMITPSALPDQDFAGTVSTIIPQASPDVDTFEVWINIANSKSQLLPGMNTFVRLQEPIHALVVPRLAVLNPDQGPTVFIVRQGHAHLRHIQMGGYVGDEIIITAGLSVGDMVVITGADALQDGQMVNIISTKQS